MSGSKASLKPKQQVVIDTHVLREAAAQPRAGVAGLERELVERVLEICARLVISRLQQKELRPQVGDFGRSFLLVPLFGQLEERGKLIRPSASQLTPLTKKQRRLLRGRGHADITDDEHLIQAARAHGGVLITCDEHIRGQSGTLSSKLDVHVFHPADVLDESPSPGAG